MSKTITTTKTTAAQVRLPADMSQKFAWLKAVLRDDRLKSSTVRVATGLYTFHNGKTGQCNPSQALLAERVAMHRPAVNVAIGELVEAGWITKTRTRGTACYVLNVERAEAEEPVEMSAENDNAPAPDVRAVGHLDVCATGQRDVCHSGQRDVCTTGQRITTQEPPRGTTKQNQGPVGQEIPADGQEAAESSPIAATSPDVPAPAIDAVSSVVEIAGLKIPAGMFATWEAALRDLDLQAAILKRARWITTLPESRRLKALETLLCQMNNESRIARLERAEKRQADVEQGVERCPITGFLKSPRPITSRFQIPRTAMRDAA